MFKTDSIIWYCVSQLPLLVIYYYRNLIDTKFGRQSMPIRYGNRAGSVSTRHVIRATSVCPLAVELGRRMSRLVPPFPQKITDVFCCIYLLAYIVERGSILSSYGWFSSKHDVF